MNAEPFAKVYVQILESSIARDYHLRHFFEDLLKLANWRTGVVDMTPEAIGRRINLPEKDVRAFLKRLEAPDEMDKSGVADGRRIELVDTHRSWGWHIVNFTAYRLARNADDRREYMKDYQRQYRAKKKGEKAGLNDRIKKNGGLALVGDEGQVGKLGTEQAADRQEDRGA